MKRLIGIPEGNYITKSEIDHLKLLALADYPSSGYAWSLYRLLTGERLNRDIPNNPTNQGIISSSTSSHNDNQIIISPNPASTVIEVQLGTKNAAQLIVYDSKASVVFSMKEPKTKNKIDVSSWISGVYVVQIVKEDGLVESARIVNQ